MLERDPETGMVFMRESSHQDNRDRAMDDNFVKQAEEEDEEQKG